MHEPHLSLRKLADAHLEGVDEHHLDIDTFGTVVSVNGSHAAIDIDASISVDILETLSVGRLIVVRSSQTRVVCLIYANEGGVGAGGRNRYLVEVEILGEIRDSAPGGRPAFDRGVSTYPHIGASAEPIRRTDLETIYNVENAKTIAIGTLVQDAEIKATVRTHDLMQKHFAVLGTTGAGKSSAVALILAEILEVELNTRILLIDPHNEYRRALGDRANVISPTNLRLPYWLFNFEEFSDAIFRGRPGVDEELDALAEYIPIARAMFAGKQGGGGGKLQRRENDGGFTVDTPVPYRISDLIALIDDEIGRLDGKGNKAKLKRLKARIESASRNGHYQFMFANLAVEDSMAEILMDLFRIPPNGKPVTILELSGFAPEIVDSVVSVICRLAFDLGVWSNSLIPVLVLCEEAHRYVPADRALGFGPTRKAISRIAKEGRKYGIHLGVVTQRPAELDPTIVSQCSTIFAMRLANENDHAIIRSAVSDAAASTLAFLPSLGNREAIAFGEGVAMPMRMRFKNLAAEALPSRESKTGDSLVEKDGAAILDEIVKKWRAAEMRDQRQSHRTALQAEAPTARRANGSNGAATIREEAGPEVMQDDPEPARAAPDAAAPTLRRPVQQEPAQPTLRRPVAQDEPPPTLRRNGAAPTLRRSTFGTASRR